MRRTTVIVFAAILAACHASSIGTSIENTTAAINEKSGSLTSNATKPSCNKTAPLNPEAVNASTKTPIPTKIENSESPEKLNIVPGLTGSLNENKTVLKRAPFSDFPSENDKIPPVSPFLPFLPLVDRQDNPLFHIFHNIGNKNGEMKNSSQKKADEKPFLFFDFFFNIREIPILNASTSSNLTKSAKTETVNINFKKPIPEESYNEKWLKRSIREDESFFDDSRLFHPLDFEEFLPKPDFFLFPDSFLHRPPSKRLMRRKRDEKIKALRFADETRKILLRKKRTSPKQVLRALLPEKIKKGAEERKVDSKKEENPALLTSKTLKIGEFYPKHFNNKEKRDTGKEVQVENLKYSQEISKKVETLLKDEKKQGSN